jgi:tetratricopeptide (TPR) repeat protein
MKVYSVLLIIVCGFATNVFSQVQSAAEAHYNLGVALYDKDDLDGAIREYREALRIQPDYADAHVNLGVALYDKGDLDGAIREYREALRIQPDNAYAHLNLAAALAGKGDRDGAIREYRIAVDELAALKERAYLSAMRSELRKLTVAEEEYFADHLSYTDNVQDLDFSAVQGVTVLITSADELGWGATVKHTGVTQTCALYYGAARHRPPPAALEGVVECQ